MVKNHDKHHLRIAHIVGLIAMRSILLSSGEHMIFLIFCKFLTEIACQTINFSNFSLGEYSGNDLNVITEYYNIYNNCYFPNFQRVIPLFYIELTLFNSYQQYTGHAIKKYFFQ